MPLVLRFATGSGNNALLGCSFPMLLDRRWDAHCSHGKVDLTEKVRQTYH
jgi:hypothetical protein